MLKTNHYFILLWSDIFRWRTSSLCPIPNFLWDNMFNEIWYSHIVFFSKKSFLYIGKTDFICWNFPLKKKKSKNHNGLQFQYMFNYSYNFTMNPNTKAIFLSSSTYKINYILHSTGKEMNGNIKFSTITIKLQISLFKLPHGNCILGCEWNYIFEIWILVIGHKSVQKHFFLAKKT